MTIFETAILPTIIYTADTRDNILIILIEAEAVEKADIV